MTPDQSALNDFLNALHQHNWPVVVGFVIVFLIYGANRMGLDKKIDPKLIPALSIVLGLLSAIGAQLILGISWTEAVTKGFMAGATATGLWETVLKHVLPKGLNVPAIADTAVAEEAPVTAPKVKKAKKTKEEAPVAASAEASTETPAATPEAPAAAATVKERKKPGPKPGAKKAKVEAAATEVAPVVPPTDPAT